MPGVAAAALAIGAMAATPAQAASFDCGKACTRVEKLICSDPALSSLDDRMATAYRAMAGAAAAPALLAAQRDWIRRRDQCADTACVDRVYQERLSALAPSQTPGAPVRASAGGQGKYCLPDKRGAYSMLLLRPASQTRLQFAFTQWTAAGSNFSVAGVAQASGGGFRYESGMASPDPSERCAVQIAPLPDGGYTVSVREGARCESLAGHGAVLYRPLSFPAASRQGDAPARPDMEALNHTDCDPTTN